jgi:hypothetical protein
MTTENDQEVNVNDFGFTFTTENSIKKENEDNVGILHEKVEIQKQKLLDLKNLIWPLLIQLRKDPDKDVIKWPNRATALNTLMKRIDSIISD